jgi:protoporphyrinogen oxidase
MLGEDLLLRPRHGRIRLRGRWIHFPLKPLDLAFGLSPSFAFGVLSDAVARRRRDGGDGSFADVLERGLGSTICRDFYFPYAQKIWGLPPSELDGEQARRRVSAGSIAKMIGKVARAVPGLRPAGHGRFYYPRRGFGQISEAYRTRADTLGVRLVTGASVRRVDIEGGRATRVVLDGDGGTSFDSRLILSTIPLTALVQMVRPAAPQPVLNSAGVLRSRAMVLVYLVLDADRFTEFDAHYFPEPGVRITRLSEPKNYGLAGRPGVTVLCAELPCDVGDDAWQMSDAALGSLVAESLGAAQLPITCGIRRVVVRRLPHAYPVYTRDYRGHFDRIDEWLQTVDGLVTFGRQGLFVHDNTHHTLAMAYAATDCIAPDGSFDRARWDAHRRSFESHVVED